MPSHQMTFNWRSLALLFLVYSIFCTCEIYAEDENITSLGDACETSEQCRLSTPNSTCSEGFCNCEAGFFTLKKINGSSCESNDVDKTDEEYVSSSESPRIIVQKVDVKMIVIMVVLAVMFIGICVALHLFSKARFRNHRTIFNSPHPRLMHIKLGEKKGRRRASHTSLEVPGSRQLSICSNLSPLQSRRGSQAASPDISQKPRRSNGEKTAHAYKAHKQDPSKSDTPSHGRVTNGPGSPTVVIKGGKTSQPNSSASAKV